MSFPFGDRKLVCEPNVPEGLGLSDLKSTRTGFRLTPDAERHKTAMREPPKEPNRAMKSSLSCDSAAPVAAPGRPREIEEATNRHLVHPVSRKVVDLLMKTAATPNQVSVASVFAAGAGAFCYAQLAWPWGAFAGLACFFAWHVL